MLFQKKDIVRLMLPLILEQIFNALVGTFDTIMVSNVGEAAIAGVANVDVVATLLIQFMAALATGGTVICAQYIGRGDRDQACMAANQMVSVSTLLSVVFLLLGTAACRPILGLFYPDAAPDVMDCSAVYLFICAFSFPMLAIFNSCAGIYRATGNAAVPMLVSVLMNVINVGGNALCIFGLKMGVEGVAIPTLVSRTVAAVVMAVLCSRSSRLIHIARHLGAYRLRKDMIRRVLHIGLPNGVENGLFNLGKIMVQSLVTTLGTAVVAGYSVAQQMAGYIILPGIALGIGLTTLVGQSMGAERPDEAKKYVRNIVLVNYGIILTLIVIIYFAVDYFVGLYVGLSPAGAEVTKQLIWWYDLFVLIWPIGFTIPTCLRAAGDVRFCMIVAVASMWAFRIGAAYVLVHFTTLGALGIYFGMFLDWLFRAAVFFVRYRRNRWTQIKIIE